MKIEDTVEWQDQNKEWQSLDVEFEGEPRWDNDSFDYAGTHCTHGMSGTCNLPDYTTMEGSTITWDKEQYTAEENKRIETFVNENYSDLEEKLCNQLEKESKEYCDF